MYILLILLDVFVKELVVSYLKCLKPDIKIPILWREGTHRLQYDDQKRKSFSGKQIFVLFFFRKLCDHPAFKSLRRRWCPQLFLVQIPMLAPGRDTIVPFGREYIHVTGHGRPVWPMNSIPPEQNAQPLTLNQVGSVEQLCLKGLKITFPALPGRTKKDHESTNST